MAQQQDRGRSALLAGILYAALGAGAAFGINAASFVLSAILLGGLRVPAAPATGLVDVGELAGGRTVGAADPAGHVAPVADRGFPA